jgi:hypothetical protein
MTRPSIATARAEALFASSLLTGSRPNRAEATHAITTAVRRHGGVRGCATEMAGTYGDRPELAARRMRWARQVVYALFDAEAPLGRATAIPIALFPCPEHPMSHRPEQICLGLHSSGSTRVMTRNSPLTTRRQ